MTSGSGNRVRRLGVDTGGTFTDLVFLEGDRLRVTKVLSTPDAPEEAILAGCRELAPTLDSVAVVHGSTVGTNAVLEGKGAKTGYVTNRGLADVLAIGRQARRELYNLQPEPQPPPVPPEFCHELDQRTAADGSVVKSLDLQELHDIAERIREQGIEALAINLLFSWLDDSAERQVAEELEKILGEQVFLSRSSKVMPRSGEYERGIATWLNAYIGPRMRNYLANLHDGITRLGENLSLAVMQSSAGTVSAAQAADKSVNLLLSGPAGGLIGARSVARLAGFDRVMSFDMGGTSTDVALIDGDIPLTNENSIAGYPVGVPSVEMHTIGAGGGSIASIDPGGLLRVGPASAGAHPGPACYARGGEQATVTDANVVLGRLPKQQRLGGSLSLDHGAARDAVAAIAREMDCDIETAADGILRIANEHMSRALRVISVERGIDPRGFTLLSFGGAGGLHVCALAENLGVDRAMVPVNAGVLSALGMIVARRSRQVQQALNCPVESLDDASLADTVEALTAPALAELEDEGVSESDAARCVEIEMRYLGQSYTLAVDWDDNLAQSVEAFHERHEQRFGHRLSQAVELADVRVGLHGPEAQIIWPEADPANWRDTASGSSDVHGFSEAVPVWRRTELAGNKALPGPVIVTDEVATTWVQPGWTVTADRWGNLLLERQQDEAPGAVT